MELLESSNRVLEGCVYYSLRTAAFIFQQESKKSSCSLKYSLGGNRTFDLFGLV